MSLRITGGNRLAGEVKVQGSKNAAQKLLAAALAVPGVHIFRGLPRISDTAAIISALQLVGVEVDFSVAGRAVLDTRWISGSEVPFEITRRSSGAFMLAGALLARIGVARVGRPGGDQIGKRPINYHLDGFRALDVLVGEEDDYVNLKARESRADCSFTFPSPSVNGTVNLIIGALRSRRGVEIRNIPDEPDVWSTIQMLQLCGAQISVVNEPGYLSLRVGGIEQTKDTFYWDVPLDRNDAATFVGATLATGGDVQLSEISPKLIRPLLDYARHLGAKVEESPKSVRVQLDSHADRQRATITSVSGSGFSTDWGPVAQIAMSQSSKGGDFTERVFTKRFGHLQEARNLGLSFDMVEENTVRIPGNQRLHGGIIHGYDIRGAASLAIGAMCAEGASVFIDNGHIARGHEAFWKRFRALGVEIHGDSDD